MISAARSQQEGPTHRHGHPGATVDHGCAVTAARRRAPLRPRTARARTRQRQTRTSGRRAGCVRLGASRLVTGRRLRPAPRTAAMAASRAMKANATPQHHSGIPVAQRYPSWQCRSGRVDVEGENRHCGAAGRRPGSPFHVTPGERCGIQDQAPRDSTVAGSVARSCSAVNSVTAARGIEPQTAG